MSGSDTFYLNKIMQAVERTAKATERTAELLEILMMDDDLVEPAELQYASVANQTRLQK